MKKTILLFFTIGIMIRSDAQNITKDGWYFLKYPENNMFGVGYTEPKKGQDVFVGACTPFQLDSESVLIHKGADEQTNIENHVQNVLITSVFNNNKNISIKVIAKKVKKQILNPSLWWRICQDDQFYFVTEALTADTVLIAGTLINSSIIDSKDIEKIITTFASPNTAAFKVIDALGAKISVSNQENKNNDTRKSEKKESTSTDTSKIKNLEIKDTLMKISSEGSGIVNYSLLKNDSFYIRIINPDVFYAIKMARITINSDGYWRPLTEIDLDQSRTLDSKKLDPEVNTLLQGQDEGYNMTVKIQYDNGLPVFVTTVVSAKGEMVRIEKDRGNKVDESTIHFDNEIPVETDYKYTKATLLRGSKNQSKMYFIGYTCEYDIKSKLLKIFGKKKIGDEYLLQNCIYAVKSSIDFWPSK